VNEVRQQIRFGKSRDGIRIAYASIGKGPPLVKAATWFSHLEFDLKGPVWGHWHDEFSRQHTLYRYDRRGCGLSDWEGEQSLEAFHTDLETVVEAAGLDKFVLFGMGHGGTVATAYAARHPERVSHLILFGAYARGRRIRHQDPRALAETELNLKLVELGWGGEDAAFHHFFTAQFMPDGTTEQMRWLIQLQRVSTSGEHAVRHLDAVFNMDVSALAPQVRCPTLIVHPNADMRITFEEGRLLASLIPGARFVPLPTRNHFLLETEPAWTQFVAELRSFLPSPKASIPGFAELSSREDEVIELVAHGLDNAQIAAWLALSEKTVRNHITAIFTKLEVDSRAQAIVRARDAGYPRKPLRAGG
jgi:pimeloyl-ACP methyl ester carboxylesterase/DNA-binding CsgD family transcriptional regulator